MFQKAFNLVTFYDNEKKSIVIWQDVEKLFIYLGARIKEGGGSRLAVELNGVRAYFHRPHPQKEIDKG
ncbi:type II toxin-antitoxin system HicA family toxin, partial [Candidatus Protochlamydia amoebophila]